MALACGDPLKQRSRRPPARRLVALGAADEALRLLTNRPGLALPHALTWASANVNHLVFVTTDAHWVGKADSTVVVPYRTAA